MLEPIGRQVCHKVLAYDPVALVHMPPAPLKVYLVLFAEADHEDTVRGMTRERLATLCDYKAAGTITEHIRYLRRVGALHVEHTIKPDGTRGPDTYKLGALA